MEVIILIALILILAAVFIRLATEGAEKDGHRDPEARGHYRT